MTRNQIRQQNFLDCELEKEVRARRSNVHEWMTRKSEEARRRIALRSK